MHRRIKERDIYSWKIQQTLVRIFDYLPFSYDFCYGTMLLFKYDFEIFLISMRKLLVKGEKFIQIFKKKKWIIKLQSLERERERKRGREE